MAESSYQLWKMRRRKEEEMWLFYAVGSAFFAGITSILAKCGIRHTDSTVATAVRTIVVLIFSWVMVFVAGSQAQLSSLSAETLVLLALSGMATGASWLCYFKALQLGNINQVVPVDKSSTVITILFALLLLGEGVSLPKGLAVLSIAIGIFLMIEKKAPGTAAVLSDTGSQKAAAGGHGLGRGGRHRHAVPGP